VTCFCQTLLLVLGREFCDVAGTAVALEKLPRAHHLELVTVSVECAEFIRTVTIKNTGNFLEETHVNWPLKRLNTEARFLSGTIFRYCEMY
jgi:hypothetical protein